MVCSNEQKTKKKIKKRQKFNYRIIFYNKKYLPDLYDKFEELTNIRHQSYVTYNMKTIYVTRLFGLIYGLTSLSNISSDEFNTDACIKNISNICNTKLSELPYWETIQIVKTLLRSKMFDKYKFEGASQILFDGTGLSNYNYNLNSNCLQRKIKQLHLDI